MKTKKQEIWKCTLCGQHTCELKVPLLDRRLPSPVPTGCPFKPVAYSPAWHLEAEGPSDAVYLFAPSEAEPEPRDEGDQADEAHEREEES